MSDKILRFSEYALHLTKALQASIGSKSPAVAWNNALFLTTALIADESRGEKMVELGAGDVKTFTLAELFKTISEKSVVKVALQEKKSSVKMTPRQFENLEIVSEYLQENGFSKKQSSPASAYLLAVAATCELHDRYSPNRQDVIEIPLLTGTKIQNNKFFLDVK